jgi:hypothetical protein
MDELEKISRELKSYVARYDHDAFMTRMTSLIKGITMPSQQAGIRGLISPLRQLLYLAYLNLSSNLGEVTTSSFPQNEWEHIKRKLYLINEIYDTTYGEQKAIADSQDAEQLAKRAVALSTYNAFFHQGPLKFEEQIIEKIQQVFKHVHKELLTEVKISPDDLIAIYDILDNLHHQKINRRYRKNDPDEQPFLDEIRQGITSGAFSFQEGMRTLAEKDYELFELETNPAAGHFFNKHELTDLYDPEKVELFLSLFCISRKEDTGFVFFSGKNKILLKPVYQMNDGRYLVVDYKLLLDAIYSFLTDAAIAAVGDSNRITRTRDKFLETKTAQVFRDFYADDKKAVFYENYYVDGSEHDLLVLSHKTALIIEAKAGNVREPVFDPDRAYDKIKKDFDKTIKYGYEQTFKIKEYFIDRKPFDIFNEKKERLATINPKDFKQVFSIVVILEKFGHIQNDLAFMLQLFEDDVYPWSVCIDDLEIYLLAMKKKGFSIQDFHLFLNLRKTLHGNLITNDEGRITGHFLTHHNFIKMRNPHGTYQPVAADDLIYDLLYAKVLGFKGERMADLKSDPRYITTF